MPALFVFLLKVNIALLLFCAGYYLVLRHLTFYTLNRIYLVTAILFASVYPEINLSEFAQRHEQLTRPVEAVVFNWQTPIKSLVNPLSEPNYWVWIEVLFWTGAILLFVRLLMQLYSLYKLYLNSTSAQIYGHKVRVVNGPVSPFSFWKSIYVNPVNHEPADLQAILLHEQVHINEWHTIDILLAELSTIFYWFNPGIWLMKKAIRENIEFITDRKILKNGADSKQYQYSLISVSFATSSNSIVSHFNISTIKKRIIMMNAKRSSKVNLTRYAFLVPAVIVLLLVFNISKAALIRKSNHIERSLTTKITASNAPIIKKNAPITKVIDTIRKGNFFISTSHHSDSLNYVINGEKATKTDFQKLDSNRIYSIEIMPAERAFKIFNQINNKNNVLFVTTDDSEAGKKFKEKIDKINGTAYLNSDITAVSRENVEVADNISSGDGISAGTSIDNSSIGSSDIVYTTVNPGNKAMKLNKKRKAATTLTADTLTITNDSAPVVEQFEGTESARAYSVKGWKNMNYSVMPKFKTMVLKPGLAYKNKQFYTLKAYTLASNFNRETNIEHLSEKMILIDGKEATEHDLKKLSAADIESMSIKSGDEITKKYGEKAKNGVVFISTKKQ